MKKVILLILSLLISFSVINISNASSLENKLYKSVIVSKIQIEKDYGSAINKKIVSIFIKFRYKKDIKTLTKLATLLKEKIKNFNNISYLTKSDRKTLNLYNNLYYRTILLLDYNL